jgi:hypothetical protein
MKIKLIKVPNLSGNEASIYSILFETDNTTSLDNFINDNISSFKSEIIDIIIRLKTIGNKTGARESFFKIHEGSPADGVCALYDKPYSHLRLYCIRYGSLLIIAGNGGEKPKNIKALQENEKLKKENEILRKLSQAITKRRFDKEIWFSNDFKDIEGDLNFII